MFAGVSSNSEKAPKAAGCGPMPSNRLIARYLFCDKNTIIIINLQTYITKISDCCNI